ncbi:hypothetical protein CRUP_028954 [Coryphaenoides rupestris]|nr:hypothetical protein CRUP_028954 [Coryphaenoides rupestris]
MVKSKSKNQKKNREQGDQLQEQAYSSVPHSFVTKRNVLKDFVSIAGPLGVTHFMIFSKTQHSVNMRLARLPRGPMLHFKVMKYALVKDVVSSLKRHRMHEQQFTHHPLLVLNNFGVEGMQVNLNSIKRCVLLNYDPVSKEVELRHYSLKVVPVGMSRGVKKLMQERFPNMNKFEDISELLMKGANLSESEAELDGDHNITELPQACAGRGNIAAQQSAVRLTEIGPRLTLQLLKIQEGMGDGNVLYHASLFKTEEELQAMLDRKQAQLKEKAARRKKQEQNVALKKEAREHNKRRSLEGIKRKRQEEGDEDSEVEDPGVQGDHVPVVESDDEAEYYRQAVGQEPDDGMFPAAKRKRVPRESTGPFTKGRKFPGKPPQQRGRAPGKPSRDRDAGPPGRPFKEGGRPQKGNGKRPEGGRSPRPSGQRSGFGGKRSGDGGKRFSTAGARGGKYGQKNTTGFKSKGEGGKPGFRSKGPGAGAKQGFKQRKGRK